MDVYIFGNEDTNLDNKPFKIAKKLQARNNDVRFITIKPNQDLPFHNKENILIIDTVSGLKKIQTFKSENLDKLITAPRSSVHDFDLAFQLKYLKKLGKLGEVTIIGVPQEGRIDYNLIQSILRKLVAQDIQGS